MARNRKDSAGSTTVDSYRKQIAKQDTKKSKVSLKEAKYKSQKKENASSQYKDIFIMIVVMILAGSGIYLALYAALSTPEIRSQTWVDA